jgi:hypothetical protein
MREDAARKATRLLVESRVQVLRLDERGCVALVRGDSGLMRTVRFEHDRWTCDCPALGYCSHAISVARVVVVNRAVGTGTDVARVDGRMSGSWAGVYPGGGLDTEKHTSLETWPRVGAR